MRRLSSDYQENIDFFDSELRVGDSFDILKKQIRVGPDQMTFYYIDGFVKDSVMQKLMMHLVSEKGLNQSGLSNTYELVKTFVETSIPYVETDISTDSDEMLRMMMSGAALAVGSLFGCYGVIIDTREYHGRGIEEPTGDKVMRGAHDGFTEMLIRNTSLIRRRIRDTALTMRCLTIGDKSKTDVVVCYMNEIADSDYVEKITERLTSIKTDALALGHESLAECMVSGHWFNPFPKIRYTERPDAAAAQLCEGSVLILVDNSPDVMILPTSFFDFLQETNDFYYPPLTGTYIRIIRQLIFWLTLILTPLWLVFVKTPEMTPEWLEFILPDKTGEIPIIAQLLLVEFIIDGLRMASLNTPDALSNSLSVVSALILGDFAVQIGWLIPEVILYMSFVAIANFTQRSYEMGYAFKFLRIGLLILVQLFGIWGLVGGLAVVALMLAFNKPVVGKRSYLYPLIPFNGRALLSLFVRLKKKSNVRNNRG